MKIINNKHSCGMFLSQLKRIIILFFLIVKWCDVDGMVVDVL